MHEIELTPLEKEGLEKHHLPTETPSQLSDSFRAGIAWALKDSEEKLENLNLKNKHFISEIQKLEKRIKILKEKKFWQSEGGDEYWIYQGDETDNLKTLTCPIIISRDDLIDVINGEME